MAQNALQTSGFYFSYTCDLTHSKQRLYNATPDFHQLPLHERVSNLLIFWQKLFGFNSFARVSVAKFHLADA